MDDLISRQAAIDALKEKVFHNLTDEFYGTMQVLDELPPVDVVRCHDCENADAGSIMIYCLLHGCYMRDTDFCNYGKQEDECG